MQRAEERSFPGRPPVKEGEWENKKVLCNPLHRDCLRPSKGAGEGTKTYLKLPFHTWPISFHTRWVWNILVGIKSLLF